MELVFNFFKLKVRPKIISFLKLLPKTSAKFGPVRGEPVSLKSLLKSNSGECFFGRMVFSKVNFFRKNKAKCIYGDPSTLFDIPNSFQTEAFLVGLYNARVLGPTVAVITNQDRVIRDVSLDWGRTINNHFVYRRINLPPLKKFSGRSLLLATTGADTFYHWLIDSLPRLFIAHCCRLPLVSFDFIIVNDADKPFVNQYTTYLGIPNKKLISLSKTRHCAFDMLFVPSLPCEGSSGDPPPWVKTFYSNFFKRNEYFQFKPKNFFVARSKSNSRFLALSRGFKTFLKNNGFKILYLENLSIARQAFIFRHAKTVIAVHGAGLANLVFSKRCNVIEIFQEDTINQCYYSLSQLSDCNYKYVVLKKNEPLRKDHILKHLP